MKFSGWYTLALLCGVAVAMSAASAAANPNAAPVGWPTPTRAKPDPVANPAPVAVSGGALTQKQMDAVLQRIRGVFRSHRPVPPYETYTIDRFQTTSQGYTDYSETYKYNVWVRTVDDAAMQRQVQRGDARGQMSYFVPLFNAAEDPGPPTADVFAPAPVRGHVATPEPQPSGTLAPVIAHVQETFESQYKVTAVRVEGDLLHVSVVPFYDVDRNRLREIYVDKKTYELKRMVATDKLFIQGTSLVYPVQFYAIFGTVDGLPVVTTIHGEVGGGYDGDGQTVEYHFTNIAFPKSLPDWYFNPRDYAQHVDDAPS
jgi:hypothetical protein